ncbi:MAG: hypothetical protein AB7V46_01635, partial [Thermomicrobiales bacterium]
MAWSRAFTALAGVVVPCGFGANEPIVRIAGDSAATAVGVGTWVHTGGAAADSASRDRAERLGWPRIACAGVCIAGGAGVGGEAVIDAETKRAGLAACAFRSALSLEALLAAPGTLTIGAALLTNVVATAQTGGIAALACSAVTD